MTWKFEFERIILVHFEDLALNRSIPRLKPLSKTETPFKIFVEVFGPQPKKQSLYVLTLHHCSQGHHQHWIHARKINEFLIHLQFENNDLLHSLIYRCMEFEDRSSYFSEN